MVQYGLVVILQGLKPNVFWLFSARLKWCPDTERVFETCTGESGLRRMFVVVWQFEIAEEKVSAFEAAYGPDGTWAKLFRTSPKYLGTELLRDAYIPFTYLTIDRWASENDFRAFRKDHDPEYESLDRSCDSLTSRETRIGAYTV